MEYWKATSEEDCIGNRRQYGQDRCQIRQIVIDFDGAAWSHMDTLLDQYSSFAVFPCTTSAVQMADKSSASTHVYKNHIS